MKSFLSIIIVVFALSLCNLTGRKSNTNSNTNLAPGKMTEATTPAPSPAQDTEITSAVPSSQSSNRGVPQISEEPPPPPRPTPRAPISAGVLNGKATHLPKPSYPAIAKAAKVSGAVNVRVTVDESGNVMSAVPVSGHPLLQASAVAAARQAKFSPTKLSGQPVKVSGVIVYHFVAQ